MRNLLEYSGSLISNDSLIVAPYDYQKQSYENILPLNNGLIKNWNIQKFSSDYSEIEHLNVINGMGVTLGDSIVGISVLSAIKKKNPKIKIKIIRPETAPSYVEELYELASSVIDELHYMPFHIQKLPCTALNIDVGNQLYSPDFHIMEMHDYFIQGLGVKLDDVNHNELSNKWLGNIDLGAPAFENYTLFAPVASTKIRSIPSKFYYDIVDMLSRLEGKRVLGFVDVNHKNYINISKYSPHTKDFIALIKYASNVYTCDSSALHIAAGFGVPTECVFNTIPPELRTKYYSNCKSIYVGNKRLEKIQSSEDFQLVKMVENNFREYLYG
ncbi:TPA: glycosyltransferase family 9 protein [Klebsiella quasipneumoniae]|nr:glycosyltransferase family 9 protein [Klebsiella quasipneumoniae]